MITLTSKQAKKLDKTLRSIEQLLKVFCPTGEGGGIDSSCSPDSGGGSSGGGGKENPNKKPPDDIFRIMSSKFGDHAVDNLRDTISKGSEEDITESVHDAFDNLQQTMGKYSGWTDAAKEVMKESSEYMANNLSQAYGADAGKLSEVAAESIAKAEFDDDDTSARDLKNKWNSILSDMETAASK